MSTRNPTGRNRRKPSDKPIEKSQKTNIQSDTNLTPATGRMRLGPYSVSSLNTINGQIFEQARKELRFPQSSKVFKRMAFDANIAAAISLIEAMISRVDWTMKAPKNAPQEEKDREEKLNFNLMSMDRPWQEYITEALSILVYGFHVPEKIYKKFEDTPVGSFTGLKDLRTISQDTVDRWIFKESNGDLAGLRQSLQGIVRQNALIETDQSKVHIDVPRKKFILFRHNPKRDNPEGTSPLLGPYLSWKYKSIIEESETISAAKGLGGILNVGVDAGFLSKASADPSSDEATAVDEMKRQAANFHNGDQGYVITPVAYNEKGKELFFTKILETKPVETENIIKRHDFRILSTFFASVLSMGAEGGGSFALSDNHISLLTLGIDSILKNIERTINHDLIPQIYELNKWDYDPRRSVKIVRDDLDDSDLDVMSKAVQRILSVDAIDKTEDIEDSLRDIFFDLPPKAEANTKKRETEISQSRAGESLGTSGTGDADMENDSSTDNTENA